MKLKGLLYFFFAFSPALVRSPLNTMTGKQQCKINYLIYISLPPPNSIVGGPIRRKLFFPSRCQQMWIYGMWFIMFFFVLFNNSVVFWARHVLESQNLASLLRNSVPCWPFGLSPNHCYTLAHS